MSLIDTLTDIALGATAGVFAVTALPVFGVAGTITALGATVGSTAGGTAALIDAINKD